ncbi:hypothetical protein M9H77_14230 [Catharanthus roseus]|uniref:Uncharacterized protein n=1 Tax=Catharanthus roseus TaxID=4058 RepID=A0ACC0BMK3_CATRO|nr:hypothetical protein M9H77_14230 [Catharanthus roseus]
MPGTLPIIASPQFPHYNLTLSLLPLLPYSSPSLFLGSAFSLYFLPSSSRFVAPMLLSDLWSVSAMPPCCERLSSSTIVSGRNKRQRKEHGEGTWAIHEELSISLSLIPSLMCYEVLFCEIKVVPRVVSFSYDALFDILHDKCLGKFVENVWLSSEFSRFPSGYKYGAGHVLHLDDKPNKKLTRISIPRIMTLLPTTRVLEKSTPTTNGIPAAPTVAGRPLDGNSLKANTLPRLEAIFHLGKRASNHLSSCFALALVATPGCSCMSNQFTSSSTF